MKENELKPCPNPKCQSTRLSNLAYQVRCKVCGTRGASMLNDEDAVIMWNLISRPAPESGSGSAELRPDKWIPVEERLPEERNIYPVTYLDTFTEEPISSHLLFSQGEWYASSEKNRGMWLAIANKVIAWMEKPEPYQEHQNNEGE